VPGTFVDSMTRQHQGEAYGARMVWGRRVLATLHPASCIGRRIYSAAPWTRESPPQWSASSSTDLIISNYVSKVVCIKCWINASDARS
jgi:hypothetical protein